MFEGRNPDICLTYVESLISFSNQLSYYPLSNLSYSTTQNISNSLNYLSSESSNRGIIAARLLHYYTQLLSNMSS